MPPVTHEDEELHLREDTDLISPSRSPTFPPSPPAYRFPSYGLESGNAKTRASPVWAVDYDYSRLVHSPSFLAFQTYYDVDGNPLEVLPQAKPSSIHLSEIDSGPGIMSANGAPTAEGPRRRLPCYNQVADAYVFQQTIDERLRRVGVSQAREDNLRLAGVQWIDSVRRALKL
jgi:hypothetical protein